MKMEKLSRFEKEMSDQVGVKFYVRGTIHLMFGEIFKLDKRILETFICTGPEVHLPSYDEVVTIQRSVLFEKMKR